ncbi:hypothetical protein [Campylobacter hyointestinalis]|uniref:hypothetical protein n=1 Tax=Campylobacter hyointestinalis TaxID=198 RepID=UPI00072775BB|nr:hypothetical protein [Campylobacter hyointestinalis]CUU72039.1 Uncharacterised protein [Campylobacter hyointestinalis subsp. hyointestinalis]
MIDFIIKFWWHICFMIFGILVMVFIALQQREQNRRAYIAKRNEEVSRISDGVAGGIIRVFENQNFINALNNGVSINIHINVDGSQNIVITGNSNSILL